MNRRSTYQIVGVALALLIVAFVLGRPEADGPPLDPESVGDLGTRGLVEFLERSGATVVRGLPDDDTDVTLVLADRLNGGSREALLTWIQAGGTAVVTDSTSPLLATGLRGLADAEDIDKGECQIEQLDDVVELSASSLGLLVPVANSTTCFGDDRGAFIVQFPDGAGTVTGLGGAVPFVNSQLDQADNAVLAGRLLLQSDTPTVSIVYSPLTEGAGQQSVWSLVGSNVRWFGWQLCVATFVGLLWAIRRFGKVVHEPGVVELPGSLAVRATAELHRRSGTPDRSAAAIKRSIDARVRTEYRLPPEVDPALAASVVAEGSDLSIDDASVLTGEAATDASDPLSRIKQLDALARRAHGESISEHPPLSPVSQREEPSNV